MTVSKSPANATDVRLAPSRQKSGNFPIIDISNIEIEDGQPVDNILSEKQQRLLVSILDVSFWLKPFFATANVGLFYADGVPALVPDVMLSLGVEAPADWSQKKNRSYFVGEIGKLPELAIEIVSNNEGNELGSKLSKYASAGVIYYVVFDPLKFLEGPVLRVYELQGTRYRQRQDFYMDRIELGLTLWQGTFEGKQDTWLRWCDKSGNLLLTYDELNAAQRQQTEAERQRAEEQQQRAEEQQQRAEEQQQLAEAERQRAEAERQRAEAERHRAEAERQRAQEQEQLAQAERQRAQEQQQLAEAERQRAQEQEQLAQAERQRAQEQQQLAEAERQRADRLAEILKSRGINPDEVL